MLGIVVADNHELIREGIASLLNMVPDFEVVSQCADGRQLVENVQSLQPQIAVVDMSLPELSGLDVAKQISRTNPSTRIIAIFSNHTDIDLRAMIDAGISGFVVKSGKVRDLVTAIRLKRIYISEEIIESIRARARGRLKEDSVSCQPNLTRREREILKLIGEGSSSKEIASKLCISETTVKTHRNHLMDKLNVRDVAGLTRESIRLKLVCIE